MDNKHTIAKYKEKPSSDKFNIRLKNQTTFFSNLNIFSVLSE